MSPSLRLPLVLAVVVAGLVSGLWALLGQPVPMPASPLKPGEKLPCVSYAPFRDGQSPFDKALVIPESQIDDDFAQLAKVAACVRTYSVEKGLTKVAPIARKHGLTVLQGIWLGPDADKNRQEIEAAIAVAQANPDVVKAVIVGNEALLRGEISPADLSATLKEVKKRVGSIPVTYADVWEFWERNKALADDVDFVTIHILPYWEDMPVAAIEAAQHVDEIRRRMAETFPGKEILIGETGWPSAGRMREGAQPSPSNQALVMHDILSLATRQGYRVNVIEAFDQPWKRRSEGTVGGHWGLIDSSTRDAKFHWGRPVEDFPHWRAHIVVGVLATALAFGSGLLAARRRTAPVPARDWIAVAVFAFAGAATLGAAFSALPLESLGLVGWLRNGAFVALALAALAVLPAVQVSGAPLGALATALDRSFRREAGSWTVAGATILALALLAVGEVAFELVFDPRYKDFPVFALTGVAVGLAVLALARRPRRTGAGLAELVGAWGLLAATFYVPLNETLENWQGIWFGLICLALAFTLWRVRDGRMTG